MNDIEQPNLDDRISDDDAEPIRCVQCGQTRDAIKESQRRGGYHKLLCATVDYFGECETDWERHKFKTKRQAK